MGLWEPAINVGEVYASLVRDLHADTYTTPGFEHALHNARLIEAVRYAERTKRAAAVEQNQEKPNAKAVRRPIDNIDSPGAAKILEGFQSFRLRSI